MLTLPTYYCLSCDMVYLMGRVRSGRSVRCRSCLKPMRFTMRPDRLPEGLVMQFRRKSGHVHVLARLGKAGWRSG